jgi:hypothetical protein
VDPYDLAVKVRTLPPNIRRVLEEEGMITPDGYPADPLVEEGAGGLLRVWITLTARIIRLEARIAAVEREQSRETDR